MPGGYQPREVRYGETMLNNTGEGRFRQGSPASPVSFDSVGANQSDSVNNLMYVNAADRSSGPTEKVIYRKQRRMIKNRESAARTRARRQVRSVFCEINLL